MIVETLLGVNWRVEEEGGQRILVLIEQPPPLEQPIRVLRIPFDAPIAKQVAAQLSGLVVTRQMPAGGPGVNGGGVG